MAQNELKIVPMKEATACELVFAAKFCGFKNVRGFTHLFNGDGAKRLESDERLRTELVSLMSSIGYNHIRIDPANRLSPEVTKVAWNIAEPIHDDDC